jgi:uncharacterized protein YqfB (UPF0267 family)
MYQSSKSTIYNSYINQLQGHIRLSQRSRTITIKSTPDEHHEACKKLRVETHEVDEVVAEDHEAVLGMNLEDRLSRR